MVKYRLYLDKDKESIWLNEMADKGFAMTGFYGGFYKFEQCEKGEYAYQIDFKQNFFSVPEDYREIMEESGIEMDGATYWQKLFNITLPLVKPSLTVATVLNIIYVFNSFPIVWTITKGDPASRTDTLVTYLYKLAFYNGKQGEAAAVSVIGFMILLVCASIYMVSTLKKGED